MPLATWHIGPESFSGNALVIRIDAIWLATTPMDMRAGTDTALARVVSVFGAVHRKQAANPYWLRTAVVLSGGG